MMVKSEAVPWHLLLMRAAAQRKQLILRNGAAGLLLSMVLAFTLPVRYASSVRLMPPDPQANAGLMMMASALGGLPAGAGGGGIAGLVNSRSVNATFLAILQSRTAQDDLVNRFDLRKVYRCKRYEQARRILRARTSIDDDKKTGVLTVSVTDSSVVRARDLAEAYIDELNKLAVVLTTSSARRERVFLEGRLKAVKQELDAASADLSRFSSKTATMDMQRQSGVELDAAARLQGELIAAESHLRGLQAIYAGGNVRVREAEARVGNLRKQLQTITGVGSSPQPDTTDQPYPSLRQLPVLGATYADLYRRVTIQTAVYETLTRQYELAKVQEAKEIPAVTVLDAPALAERRSFPPRFLICLIGLLIAMAGTAGWLLLEVLLAHAPERFPALAPLAPLLLRPNVRTNGVVEAAR